MSALAGIGVFLTRITRAWDSSAAAAHAAKAREARVRNVVLCAEGDDGWTAPPIVLARAAETYRELASARVWVYALHSPRAAEEPERAAERLGGALHVTEGAGIVLDIERAFRGRPDAVRKLVATAIDQLSERSSLAVTSYPLARHIPDLPWHELRAGVGVPQVYQTAASRRDARDAIAEWRTRHGRVVPALAGFDTRSSGVGAEQLLGDLVRVCTDDDGHVDVDGVLIWQDAALDHQERRVLAEWSERNAW